MKNFLLLLIICFSITNLKVYADFTYTNNPNIITAPHHNRNFGKKIIISQPANINNITDISAMEQTLFRRNYNHENLNSRLSRLEENIFGHSINGTISERYKNLSYAFDYNKPYNYSSYSQNPFPVTPIYSQGPYSYETNQKLGIINKLANFLIGNPTGITTGISPEINDSGFQNSYQTPYGYGFSNQSRGSGMKVRILD